MTAPDDHTTSEPARESAGEEHAEVRARMRRRLAEARERHDESYWARLRERFGLPARAT